MIIVAVFMFSRMGLRTEEERDQIWGGFSSVEKNFFGTSVEKYTVKNLLRKNC
jgi:hypothetical protein